MILPPSFCPRLSQQLWFGSICCVLAWLSGAELNARPAFELPMLVTQSKTGEFEEARILWVSPGGSFRVWSEGFYSACDPNVSFDGQRVLFAGKRERTSSWRIWEMGIDGQALRAVSPENLDARSPIHVSTLFTLNSPEPWFTTVFVGGERTLNDMGRASASSLYNVKLDGTELRRLTFNPNRDFEPFQMWDGRVLYAAERHLQEPGTHDSRIGLFAIHIEGADVEFYGGGLGRPIQRMPCATEGGLVIFVEPAADARDGAGQLACIEERRPHATYRCLTRNPAELFLYPFPWRGNRILVSRRPAHGSGTGGIYHFDVDSGECAVLFDNPEYHDVQVVAIEPRARPDGHSTVVDPKFDFGVFYGLNCYDADARMAPHLTDGMIKRVRFIEGVLQSAASSAGIGNGRGPYVPRRLIGEAPVETDGSFNVEVPADTPLLLQMLDERGLALATCGWIWVKPKETRGCIGCHEDPERTPENEYALALRRPSNRLLLPAAQRRAISFRNEIAPLLRQHCVTTDCHGGESTPLRMPFTSNPPTENDVAQAYEALMALAGDITDAFGVWPQPGCYVDAGRARTSWLVWQLMGENTSRGWDHDPLLASGSHKPVRRMPPPDAGAPLSAEALRTLVQWIDLGAQFEPPALIQPELLKTP
jgi:hypothetical protein